VRTALYEAANVILTRPIKGGGLKSWAMPAIVPLHDGAERCVVTGECTPNELGIVG
jgi:hypothetical protein